MFIPISQKVNELLEKEKSNARKVAMIHPVTINIIKIFNSASEAARFMGYSNHSHISQVCRGELIQAYGYFWRYLDEYFKELCGEYYIKCYSDSNDNSIVKTQFKCSIFDFLVYNNLSNYIQPCFIYQFGEIWKDVVGYEGLYKVSNWGRIMSLIYFPYIYEIKFEVIKDGYHRVNLCKDGKIKHYFVHYLVAQAFIPNPNNYPCINHKDENKLNNHVNNLEWCTVEYNNNYGSRNLKSALSNGKTIQQINLNTGEVIKEYWSISEASRITKINRKNINNVCNNYYKSAGGYGWKFKKED